VRLSVERDNESCQMSDFEGVLRVLRSSLSTSDSAGLWEVALNKILADSNDILVAMPARQRVALQVGSCSRWLAPHRFRWTAKNGQFVAPAGYQSHGRFLRGIPEFDWVMCFDIDPLTRSWVPTFLGADSRLPLIRVAIPARTVSRQRASVHVLWQRGPRPDFTINRSYYGFRLSAGGWRYRAYYGPQIPRSSACITSTGPGLVPANEN
jgi:hypothetical protein